MRQSWPLIARFCTWASVLALATGACAHGIPYSDGIANLESQVMDPNGFQLNPYWEAQRLYPTERPSIPELCKFRVRLGQDPTPDNLFMQPKCTIQKSLLSIDKLHNLSHPECRLGAAIKPPRFPGHLNWFPATVHGTGRWVHVDPLDRDVNLLLAPDPVGAIPAPGITAKLPLKNQVMYKLEFDVREVFDPMARPAIATRLWQKVLANLRHPEALLNGKRYVAIGLFGLDAEHDYHAELHPVWGLAVRTEEAEHTESWILFARDSGNEGGCSSREAHLVPFAADKPRALIFDLPLRTAGAQLNTASVFRNTRGQSILVGASVIVEAGSRWLRVTIPLDIASGGTSPLVQGEIQITYK